MKCSQCGAAMVHAEIDDYTVDEDMNEIPVTRAYWVCGCGHSVNDWEDDYEFPD